MSDTAKLIIELPKEIADDIKETYKGNDVLYCAVKYGTLLDDVKAEIRELRDSWEKDCYHDEAEALNIALKIIDKHIGKVESEKV